MALPTLTPEQRAQALAKAAQARTARATVKDELKSGRTTLREVLTRAEQDEHVGKMKVSAVLEALPGVGPVTAARTMTDLHIAATRRVRGLGPHQSAALLERFPA